MVQWFNVGCHVQSDYCLFCVCGRLGGRWLRIRAEQKPLPKQVCERARKRRHVLHQRVEWEGERIEVLFE